MRAFGLLELEVSYPYGPRMAPNAMGGTLMERFPKMPLKYERQIQFIANSLGDKGVVDLEKLATAYYVMSQKKNSDDVARAKMIV